MLGKTELVYSNKLLPFNIKSINPIQKHPHIIESYTCTLKMFAVIFLLPIIFIISFGICSTPKLPKYITVSPFTCTAIYWVPIDLYLSRFITYAPFFILGKLFLEQTRINLANLLY